MNTVTHDTKLDTETMRSLELVHIDDVMEYLDSLNEWTDEEIKGKIIELHHYVKDKFDISMPDAHKCMGKWIHRSGRTKGICS